MLAPVTATRYVTPLREGGSLPGLMEADDLGTYVVKWRAAGQGVNVLVAEVVCGELARALGLPVPDAGDRRRRPGARRGGARRRGAGAAAALGRDATWGWTTCPVRWTSRPAPTASTPALAGRVLWFDALVGNVDRSWRNPNMLFWHGRLQLIDHGAALTFHHHWPGAAAAVDAALRRRGARAGRVRARRAGRRRRAGARGSPATLLDERAGAGARRVAGGRAAGRGPRDALRRPAARPAGAPATPGCRRWSPPRRPAGGAPPGAAGENRPSWLGPPPPEGVTQR